MEKKLYKTIAFLMFVTILGVLVLLPYRLYDRDTLVAKQHAQVVSDELSNMIKLTMLTTKEVLSLNPDLGLGVVIGKINSLYEKFGANQDFDFRVVRAPVVEYQYTAIEGRRADNPQIKAVIETGKPQSKVDGAMLSYWAPIAADAACGHCHKTESKKAVVAGTTLGVVETVFDLTRQKERSIRTITEITGFLVVMIGLMGFLTVVVIRRNLIQPLRGLIATLQRRKQDPTAPLPAFSTSEMKDLVDAIEDQSEW